MNERMKSRNTVIGILSALLIAAVISGAILYREHLKTKDALQAIEKKLLNMNEDIIPSKNAQVADLKNRLKVSQSNVSDLEAKNAAIKTNLGQLQKRYDAVSSQLEGLEKANRQISKLNQMISAKDQSISESEEKISKLEKDLEEEQNARKSLKADLTAKEAVLAGLQNTHTDDLEDLKITEGKISELKSAVNGRDQRISKLGEKLKDLEKEFEKEKKVNASVCSELSSKNSLVASLQEEIKGKQADMLHLKEEMTKDKREIERLRLALSDLEGKEEIAHSEMGRLKSTYKKLVSDLHDQLKNYEVAIRTYRERISITFVDRILFDSGKADINAQGRRILKKVGETLREVKDRQIRIVGHTDDVPIMKQYRYKFPTNWELSAARAAAVVRYFQKETGLDPKNMEAVGRSFYQPLAGNETEQGRARNRRVNIIIGPRVR